MNLGIPPELGQTKVICTRSLFSSLHKCGEKLPNLLVKAPSFKMSLIDKCTLNSHRAEAEAGLGVQGEAAVEEEAVGGRVGEQEDVATWCAALGRGRRPAEDQTQHAVLVLGAPGP